MPPIAAERFGPRNIRRHNGVKGAMRRLVGTLGVLGRVSPALAKKAELARIGRYYATESMLVLDPVSGTYDATATPSTGTDTLESHYARLITGEISSERGDHAVF